LLAGTHEPICGIHVVYTGKFPPIAQQQEHLLMISQSTFEMAGYPTTTNLATEEWKSALAALEAQQKAFLAEETHFRSPDYRWPRDPLYTWSRVWEYPYVMYHIEQFRSKAARTLNVADIGSGVTFFPFALAKLDLNVSCIDIDPICARDIPAAAKVVDHAPGRVQVGIIENSLIPLPDESQDIVYCISVLEHIPDFGQTIEEMFRILKPGGKLILTIDVDLRGDAELGPRAFEKLQASLANRFDTHVHERPSHPAQLLTTATSPYPLKHASLLGRAKQAVKNMLAGRLFSSRTDVIAHLAVHCAVLSRKQ
jgi:SAM-dependent methyltransferase